MTTHRGSLLEQGRQRFILNSETRSSSSEDMQALT